MQGDFGCAEMKEEKTLAQQEARARDFPHPDKLLEKALRVSREIFAFTTARGLILP
jgi:hypothetical protein